VTKGPPKNIAASVHQRLLNKARESKRTFNELLQYFAMERFLYRLSKSPYADKFVLKGALMFVAWQGPVSRPTMDIDFLVQTKNDIDVILEMIKAVCTQDVEVDGIVFDASTVAGERITEDADYEGIRVKFHGNLGNARIRMQLDIGFGDVVIPSAEMLEYPTILDLPAPVLRGYSKESAIAEKFEAMIKLGILNSRMKDFFDIWLLSRQFDFEGQTLYRAIEKTFANRETRISVQPVVFTEIFYNDPLKNTQWRGFIRRNRLENIPQDFSEIIIAVTDFLRPIATALSANQNVSWKWIAPGPWSK